MIQHPIPPENLDPASALGQLYGQLQEAERDLSQRRAELHDRRNEQNQVTQWLAAATLGTVTALAFAERTAEGVLLARAVATADARVYEAAQRRNALKERWGSEYHGYRYTAESLTAEQKRAVPNREKIAGLEQALAARVNVAPEPAG